MDEIEDAVATGFRPVMKFDQATGLCGGMLVCNGLKSPVAMSLLK